jgi:hypothetical protein
MMDAEHDELTRRASVQSFVPTPEERSFESGTEDEFGDDGIEKTPQPRSGSSDNLLLAAVPTSSWVSRSAHLDGSGGGVERSRERRELAAELEEAYTRMAQMQAVCVQADECLADNARALAAAQARAEACERRADAAEAALRTRAGTHMSLGGVPLDEEEMEDMQAALDAAAQRISALEGRAKTVASQVMHFREEARLADARAAEAQREVASWRAAAEAAQRDSAAARAEVALAHEQCARVEAQLLAAKQHVAASHSSGENGVDPHAASLHKTSATASTLVWHVLRFLLPAVFTQPRMLAATQHAAVPPPRPVLDGRLRAIDESGPHLEVAEDPHGVSALQHQVTALTARLEEASSRANAAEQALQKARSAESTANEAFARREEAAATALRDAQVLILQLQSTARGSAEQVEHLQRRCTSAEAAANEASKELRALLAAAQDALGEAQRRVDAAHAEAEASRAEAAALKRQLAPAPRYINGDSVGTPPAAHYHGGITMSPSPVGVRPTSPPRTPHALPWAQTLRSATAPAQFFQGASPAMQLPTSNARRDVSPARYSSPTRRSGAWR